MTVQEEYELSCYEELAQIKENKSVYLVRHIETRRICIKKKIDVYNQSVYLKLKDMKPEGMPRIHFCAEQNGKLIIIEDYIQGRSLQDIYDMEGTFSEKQVIGIVWELCNILQRLHEYTPSIIHRDIKPSNIMLSDDGVVKLIDFNAAKEFAEGKTEDTQFIGARDFAAPEQYGFGQSDVRTDIYAIGVTMNYLLTGMVPRKSMYKEVLGEVIGKCVRLDAVDRYQSVRELKDAIAGKVAEGTPQKQGKPHDNEEYQKMRKQPQKQPEKKHSKELYQRKTYLPVGFRTGKIWKMITAVFGYWILIYSCMSMTFKGSSGQEMTGVSLWVNRWGTLLLFLGYIFYTGDYMKIRSKTTAAGKSRFSKILLSSLYLFLYSFFVVMMIIFLE